MADRQSAAARFYQSVQDYEARRPRGGAASLETAADPSHRYYGAYRAIRDEAPRAVLELGAGYAGPSKEVADMGDFEYHVVDIVDHDDPGNLPARISTHVLNLDDDFPFEAGRFDLILALMVVEHLYDPFHAMSEISRVLAREGRLVMNLPNIAAFKRRLEILGGRLPMTSTPDWFERRQWDGGHLHYFTVEAVTRLCALYSLKVERLLPVGRGLALKRLNVPLLCGEITYVCRKVA